MKIGKSSIKYFDDVSYEIIHMFMFFAFKFKLLSFYSTISHFKSVLFRFLKQIIISVYYLFHIRDFFKLFNISKLYIWINIKFK